MHIFSICGYGIPQDISQDKNYLIYLTIVFNTIYDIASNQEAYIIFCGGPTNCTPPYTGTEAETIAPYFQKIMEREEVKEKTAQWNIITETTSLSSLENYLNTKAIIEEKNLDGEITFFCEKTREKKNRAFVEKIFHNQPWKMITIDFDTSKNRYIDKEILEKKEERAMQEGLKALENPEILKKYREYFAERINFLKKRQSEGVSHVDAVNEWTMKQKYEDPSR